MINRGLSRDIAGMLYSQFLSQCGAPKVGKTVVKIRVTIGVNAGFMVYISIVRWVCPQQLMTGRSASMRERL